MSIVNRIKLKYYKNYNNIMMFHNPNWWIMDFKNKATNLFKHVTNSYLYLNYNKKIDERIVYCESRDGYDFTGNVLRIIEELSRGDYGKLKIYVRADDDEVKSKIKYFKKKYNLKIHKIISGTTRSIKLLERPNTS